MLSRQPLSQVWAEVKAAAAEGENGKMQAAKAAVEEAQRKEEAEARDAVELVAKLEASETAAAEAAEAAGARRKDEVRLEPLLALPTVVLSIVPGAGMLSGLVGVCSARRRRKRGRSRSEKPSGSAPPPRPRRSDR